MKTRTLIIGFIFIVLFDLLFTSLNGNENTKEVKTQKSIATIECKVDKSIELLANIQDLTTMPMALQHGF